jgi:hypothetical protein
VLVRRYIFDAQGQTGYEDWHQPDASDPDVVKSQFSRLPPQPAYPVMRALFPGEIAIMVTGLLAPPPSVAQIQAALPAYSGSAPVAVTTNP